MTEQLTVHLERERETKNKVRFRELGDETEHVMGALYVSKPELARIGDPSRLTVTVIPAAA
jgi:hypothetical protein